MSKYLITGGAGFIGSHLSRALLSQGHDVVILDDLSTGKIDNVPKEADFIQGSVLDKTLLNKAVKNIDGCFHLAAILSMEETRKHWLETHEVNTVGTINILKTICQQQNSKQIPIVYTSSCAVYGECKSLPLKESEKTYPISIYGADKLCSEIHAYTAHYLFGNPIICLRLFNVYGLGQDPSSPYSGVISQFMYRLSNNKPLFIYGDGNQTRDFIYVKDVIQFLLRAMSLPHKQYFLCNVATGNRITINELADMISKILNKTPNIAYQSKREGDVYHSVGDPAFSSELLHYQSQYQLEEGLRDYFVSMQ